MAYLASGKVEPVQSCTATRKASARLKSVQRPFRQQKGTACSILARSMLLQAPVEALGLADYSERELIDLDVPGTIFIFGLGYVALGLGAQLQIKGWTVSGTTRTPEKRDKLREQGYEAFVWDPDHMSLGLGKGGLKALRQASHVLIAFSPPTAEEYCPILWILGREFKSLKENLRWIGYLSSTSVYGNYNGQWVDEECELKATRSNGLARAASESAWLYFGDVTGLPVQVFRLAGIYGPGRNAIQVARYAESGKGKRDGKQYTSRCHVHDICKALMASMASPIHGEIYNVADDDPTNREAVVKYVQEELIGTSNGGQSPATSSHSDLKPMNGEEKRVSNAKIKEQLGVALDFPSYREGLRAIYDGNQTPFN